MSTPPTSYILDMVRALYINNSDPSTMNKDPVQGLKERETDLAKLTHEYLQKSNPDYEEQEAEIAATIGGKLTELMLGLISIEDLSQKPPTITFSNFEPYHGSSSSSSSSGTPDTNIYSNTPYYLDAIITGGNMNMTQFTYEWSITKKPTPGDVSFIEYSSIVVPIQWNLTTIIEFSDPGTYVIQLKVTSTVYTDITSVLTTSALVI